MPVGKIIAKDSFAADQSDAFMRRSALYYGENAGRLIYVSGDWRYTLIQPDRSASGSINGDNADSVFRVSCRLAAKKNQLFFVPNEFRRSNINFWRAYVLPYFSSRISAIPSGAKCRTLPPNMLISFTNLDEMN